MNKKGFSLIEVLLSGAIFAVVAIVGSATLTNVLKTRAYNIRNTAVNNTLRVGIESALREIRDAHYVGYNDNQQICLYNKQKVFIKSIGIAPFDGEPSGSLFKGIAVTDPTLAKKFISTQDTIIVNDSITGNDWTVNGQFNNAVSGDCATAAEADFSDQTTPWVYIGLTADYYPESGYQKNASIIVTPRN